MGRRADRKWFTVEDVGAVPVVTHEAQLAARERNGEYKGSLPVRHLPPGVHGADLRGSAREPIGPGQLWRRGEQLVRITSADGNDVRFIELTPPGTQRRVPRVQFMRTSRREVL